MQNRRLSTSVATLLSLVVATILFSSYSFDSSGYLKTPKSHQHQSNKLRSVLKSSNQLDVNATEMAENFTSIAPAVTNPHTNKPDKLLVGRAVLPPLYLAHFDNETTPILYTDVLEEEITQRAGSNVPSSTVGVQFSPNPLVLQKNAVFEIQRNIGYVDDAVHVESIPAGDFWLENLAMTVIEGNKTIVTGTFMGFYAKSTILHFYFGSELTTAVRVSVGPPLPTESTDPRSWTIAETQGFMMSVEEKQPGVSKQMNIEDTDADGCVYAKMKWLFNSSPANFDSFHNFVSNFGWKIIKGEPVGEFKPSLFAIYDRIGERKEQIVNETEAIPLIGAGYVPEEAYFVSRLIRSIDHPVVKLVIAQDGPFPKGFWGRCWRKEIKQLRKERPEMLYFQSSRQRGCSAGWNTILNQWPEHNAEYALIFNADTAFRPNGAAHVPEMIRKRVAELDYNGERAGVLLFHWEFGQISWSAFVLLRSTFQKLGYFDENFFPSFSEDDDYRVRLRLSGLVETPMGNEILLVHNAVGATQHVSGTHTRGFNIHIPSVSSPKTPHAMHPLTESKSYIFFKWNFFQCTFEAPFDMRNTALGYWKLNENRRNCIASMASHCQYELNEEEKQKRIGDTFVDCWGCAETCDERYLRRDTGALTICTAARYLIVYSPQYAVAAEALHESLLRIGVSVCFHEVNFNAHNLEGVVSNIPPADLLILVGTEFSLPGRPFILFRPSASVVSNDTTKSELEKNSLAVWTNNGCITEPENETFYIPTEFSSYYHRTTPALESMLDNDVLLLSFDAVSKGRLDSLAKILKNDNYSVDMESMNAENVNSNSLVGLIDRSKMVVLAASASPLVQTAFMLLLARSKCIVFELPLPCFLNVLTQQEPLFGIKFEDVTFSLEFLEDVSSTSESIIRILGDRQGRHHKSSLAFGLFSRIEAFADGVISRQLICKNIPARVRNNNKLFRLMPASNSIHVSHVASERPEKGNLIATDYAQLSIRNSSFAPIGYEKQWDLQSGIMSMAEQTIPISTVFDRIPMSSCIHYPKHLMRMTLAMPGVEVSGYPQVHEDELDQRVVKSMAMQFSSHLKHKLTNVASTRDLMMRAGLEKLPTRVLFLGGDKPDAFSDGFLVGLLEMGIDVIDVPEIQRIFKGGINRTEIAPSPFLEVLEPRTKQPDRTNIKEKLQQGYFDLVVLGNAIEGHRFLAIAVSSVGIKRIIALDGFLHGDHLGASFRLGIPYYKKELAFPRFPEENCKKCFGETPMPPSLRTSSMIDMAQHDVLRKVISSILWLSTQIVEVGCGDGSHLVGIDFSSTRYKGVDINVRYLEIAAKNFPHLRFVNEDMIQYLRGSLRQEEIVICINVLEEQPPSVVEAFVQALVARRDTLKFVLVTADTLIPGSWNLQLGSVVFKTLSSWAFGGTPEKKKYLVLATLC